MNATEGTGRPAAAGQPAHGIGHPVRSTDSAEYAQNYSDIAMLGRVSKPRVTQIMNLLNLAPDIQEQLLFLPATRSHRDTLSERSLRALTQLVDWTEQRSLFAEILGKYLRDCASGR